MEKMIMTQKLANQLMDTLMCLHLTACRGHNYDINDEFIQECAATYARHKFLELTAEFEKLGKEFEIIDNDTPEYRRSQIHIVH